MIIIRTYLLLRRPLVILPVKIVIFHNWSSSIRYPAYPLECNHSSQLLNIVSVSCCVLLMGTKTRILSTRIPSLRPAECDLVATNAHDLSRELTCREPTGASFQLAH